MIRAEKTDLWVGSISTFTKDIPYNPDSYAIVPFQPSSDSQPVSTLAVVADGFSISAKQDGKMVSQLTVNAIVGTFSQAESAKVPELWCKGFEVSSKSIAQYSASRTESDLLQVTCVAVLVMNRRLYVASLGDCRAFLLHQQRIQQISVADSLVDKMIERGAVTYEELRNSIIDVRGPTRWLPHDSRPDLRLRLYPNETDEHAEANQGMQLCEGDQVILCTSHLYGGYVSPEDALPLRSVLLRHDHPQEAVEELEAAARQRGSLSTITIIALKIPQLS